MVVGEIQIGDQRFGEMGFSETGFGEMGGHRRPRRRQISMTYRVEFPWSRSRRLTSYAKYTSIFGYAAVEFFRAAAVAFD